MGKSRGQGAANMQSLDKLFTRFLGCCLLVFIIGVFFGFLPHFALGADSSSRLAAGEIIFSFEAVPGSGLKKGRVTGVVAAPPEKVWEVITDVNNFQFFMPRMLRSRLVRQEELNRILQTSPSSAGAVEAILSSSPPAFTLFRVPGRKYNGYVYGHVKVPWPLGNRWYVLKVQWDESQAARHIYTSSWSLLTGNLKENRGDWKVEPFGDQKTLLTYRVVTDPGGLAPKFLVEKITAQTLPQIIIGVRNRLASRR
jgi:carbon monoxide dehydrogenase subunit G